jgi:UDP-N-acetyl-D-glucosamine dehydrogenase
MTAADCVVIVTDHTAYDWEWVAQEARLIVDTRNSISENGQGRVIKL